MFSPQQPMRNYPQPGPPRPMPNQRMMGRRPPNMRGPSFGAQQQGFQQAGQFLPQANAGARNGAGAGGGLKGMLSRLVPGGGGAGSAGFWNSRSRCSSERRCWPARHSKHCQSCILIQYAWKCAKSTRHGAASHPYDPAVRPISPQSASNDEAVQPIK